MRGVGVSSSDLHGVVGHCLSTQLGDRVLVVGVGEPASDGGFQVLDRLGTKHPVGPGADDGVLAALVRSGFGGGVRIGPGVRILQQLGDVQELAELGVFVFELQILPAVVAEGSVAQADDRGAGGIALEAARVASLVLAELQRIGVLTPDHGRALRRVIRLVLPPARIESSVAFGCAEARADDAIDHLVGGVVSGAAFTHQVERQRKLAVSLVAERALGTGEPVDRADDVWIDVAVGVATGQELEVANRDALVAVAIGVIDDRAITRIAERLAVVDHRREEAELVAERLDAHLQAAGHELLFGVLALAQGRPHANGDQADEHRDDNQGDQDLDDREAGASGLASRMREDSVHGRLAFWDQTPPP
eukprot:TRINITY_DN12964_c0_g1_i11.p1 TRINITY_DN12964_c0_g1~~TRINITY_DN12964_c0_g1_i11.p1  ORF type:complete len:364 (-),score=44.07 TRINITY_DN12964_c0_g1_i11:399-1490(-)